MIARIAPKQSMPPKITTIPETAIIILRSFNFLYHYSIVKRLEQYFQTLITTEILPDFLCNKK